jgi:exonuclease VII large subunit
MSLIGWIGVVVLAVLVGAVLGWWIVNGILARQFKTKLQRASEKLNQHHAATHDRLRSAHTRAQLELEQLRATIPKQISAATTDARAKISWLEEQLRQVHAELDRNRVKEMLASGDREVAPDGFAATQTFGNTR